MISLGQAFHTPICVCNFLKLLHLFSADEPRDKQILSVSSVPQGLIVKSPGSCVLFRLEYCNPKVLSGHC